MNINIEKIKQTLKNTKKMVLQRALPFMLATTVVVGTGTLKAKADNVEFSTVTISYDNDLEYAKENDYKSSYVTKEQSEKINKELLNIDNLFNSLYETMANGGMNINHTKTKENSMARFLASINEISEKIFNEINNMNNQEQDIIKKYLESKISEAKLAFYSVTNISTKDLTEFGKSKVCVFANSLNQNNVINIGIYEIKNGNILESKIISIDDSKLQKNNTLVIIPEIKVVYNGNTPSFKTAYTTQIINKNDLKMYNQAVNDIEIFYSKLENALEKGNYTKKANQDSNDIYLSLFGDSNLVNQTINNKYQAYKNLNTALNKYLNYKQSLLVSKAYSKNNMKYIDYVKYQTSNTPIRINEENGFVYYQLNNEIEPIIDRKIIKTSDLKSSVVTTSKVQINASTGVNIYVDGKLYIPTDIYGREVDAFLYKGTTYLPTRAISNVFNADIEWKNNAVYLTSKEADGTYYIDENGNKVYLNTYPEIPDTTNKPKTKLTTKNLSGSKGIKIYFNGKQFIPTDVNGNAVDTYIFNGTTYLPVRAISNLFGAEIEWDNTINGVRIQRNQIIKPSDDYYIIEDGKPVYIPEDEIDFGNEVVNKPYYIDENGNKVYIDEDEYDKTR